MSRTGSNHKSNTLESWAELSRINWSNGLIGVDSRVEQGRIMGRTGVKQAQIISRTESTINRIRSNNEQN